MNIDGADVNSLMAFLLGTMMVPVQNLLETSMEETESVICECEV
jgi:hypothetical protein